VRVAYIQSIGGASGDMLLGALLDLGLPLQTLKERLGLLNLDGYQLSTSQQIRCEVRGTKLSVDLADDNRLSPRVLLDTVGNSALPADIQVKAKQVLIALWQAESRVHGEPQDALELEELGTIDTLIDVVGVIIGLKELGVKGVYASPLILGAATPPRRPGGYSNPAPATLELASISGAKIAPDNPLFEGAGELTTPTGAAIITSLATFQRPSMTVSKIGVGLGRRDPAHFPNVVRIWLGDTEDIPIARTQGNIVLLETNLDDVTGEILGYTQERLFTLGALDVWNTPIQMKKNRPGVILSVLVPQDLESAAVELILRETPTLGVRTRLVERYAADRHILPVETTFGVVNVKVKSLEGKRVSASPEFEECRRIALEKGLPFQEVYQKAVEAARNQLLYREESA